MRVLVVGGGLTAGALRHFLSHSSWPSSTLTQQLDLHCWESDAQLGGRMNTVRRHENDLSFCDTGAQYLTRFSEDFGDVFALLEQRGVLREMHNAETLIAGMREDHRSLRHYAPSRGFSEVVASLAEGMQVELDMRVVRIEMDTDDTSTDHDENTHTAHTTTMTTTRPRRLRVTAQREKKKSERKGEKESENEDETVREEVSDVFDAVVLTTPAPIAKQVLSPPLLSAVPQNWAQGSLRDFLDSTSYSSRFAFAAFFSLTADSAREVNALSWRSKYDFEDDMLRFVSIENYKQTASWSALKEQDTLALLLHSSIPFALQHKDTPRGDIEQRFIDKIHQYFPSLRGAAPLQTSLRHWEISQAARPSLDVGERHLLVSCDENAHQTGARLIVAGDMFLGSNFENTLRSAKASAETILKILSERQQV